jgi:serine phosphatase RsbU (regulator of sigma subunit)
MMKIFKIILLLFLLKITNGYCEVNVDSLWNIVNTTKIDSVKCKTYIDIFLNTSDYEKAKKLKVEIERFALFKLKNNKDKQSNFLFRKTLGHLYFYYGNTEYYANNQDECLRYYFESEIQYKLAFDTLSLITVYNDIGYIYNEKGDFANALSFYHLSVDYAKKKAFISGLTSSLTNIGNLYENLGDPDIALKYYLEALKLENGKNKFVVSSTLFNIATIYKNKSELDTALTYYQNSLILFDELKNKNGYAYCLNSIGYIYFLKKDFNLAQDNIKKALILFDELKSDKGKIFSYMYLSELYLEKNDLENALKYAEMALNLSKSISYFRTLRGSYLLLSKIYPKFKKYQLAYESSQSFISLNDSLINENNRKLSIKKEVGFQLEKRENELKLISKLEKDKIQFKADEDKKRHKLIIYGVLVFAFLVIILAVFIYRSYLLKKKSNWIILNQKQEVEQQKLLVENKNHEITQSIQYAQKIQIALLPNEEIFRRFLPDSFIIFKPKDIVSGDFYWLSDREDYIFYATADSTGHGVPGGFMSMLGTALLNEIIDERKIKDCGEALTLMREKIMQALKQTGDSESKDGMDMVLIRIDKKTLQMEYAAANNSFYLVSNKQLAIGNENCKLQTANCQLLEMPCDKMPVGVYHSKVKPFQTFKHQLQKGDIIYTYTDGYADQFGGEKGKKFTYKRLREKLVAISEKPLAEQKMSLENEFESWKGDNEQIDDVCLIGVKV